MAKLTKTSVSAARLDAAAATLLAGKKLLPDDHYDRQDLARIASQLRNERLLPVETEKLKGGVVAYFLTEEDLREHKANPKAQQLRMRQQAEAAKDQRDARLALKLFARRGWPLPYELTELAALSDAEMDKLFDDQPNATDAPAIAKEKVKKSAA